MKLSDAVKSRKFIPMFVIAALLGLAVIVFVINKPKEVETNPLWDPYELPISYNEGTTPVSYTDSYTVTESVEVSYIFEDILAHNTPEDCRVSYEDSVFEIPYAWATTHPGGFEAFLQACGNDITDIMKTHATSLPYEILSDFRIGSVR